jgi:hypothetical protein
VSKKAKALYFGTERLVINPTLRYIQQQLHFFLKAAAVRIEKKNTRRKQNYVRNDKI